MMHNQVSLNSPRWFENSLQGAAELLSFTHSSSIASAIAAGWIGLDTATRDNVQSRLLEHDAQMSAQSMTVSNMSALRSWPAPSALPPL